MGDANTLVQRLRDPRYHGAMGLRLEAADTIERLERDVKELREELKETERECSRAIGEAMTEARYAARGEEW